MTGTPDSESEDGDVIKNLSPLETSGVFSIVDDALDELTILKWVKVLIIIIIKQTTCLKKKTNKLSVKVYALITEHESRHETLWLAGTLLVHPSLVLGIFIFNTDPQKKN